METQQLRAESHDDRSGAFRGAFSEQYDESKVLRSECVLLHLRLDPPDVKKLRFHVAVDAKTQLMCVAERTLNVVECLFEGCETLG